MMCRDRAARAVIFHTHTKSALEGTLSGTGKTLLSKMPTTDQLPCKTIY
jgi:hypothetical protein